MTVCRDEVIVLLGLWWAWLCRWHGLISPRMNGCYRKVGAVCSDAHFTDPRRKIPSGQYRLEHRQGTQLAEAVHVQAEIDEQVVQERTSFCSTSGRL